MKKHHKAVSFSIIGIVLLLPILCIVGLWLSTRSKSKFELLWSLTAPQRQCAEQIIGTSELLYVKKLDEGESVAIGYTADVSYYVTIYKATQDEQCNIEFQEETWNCYEQMRNDFCGGNKYTYRLRPKNVEYVDLTDNESPEVHVEIDTFPGKYGGGYHVFYIKQADGSFDPALDLRLCAGMNTVEIDSVSQKIVATTDLHCDEFGGSEKEVLECTLTGEEPHCVETRHDDLLHFDED